MKTLGDDWDLRLFLLPLLVPLTGLDVAMKSASLNSKQAFYE
jgi:hypothetical protein